MSQIIYINVIVLLLWSFANLAEAQSHLSTPMEIMAFMESSPTRYEIAQLYGQSPKRPRKVLANGTYVLMADAKEYALNYEDQETPKEKRWRKQALELRNTEKPNQKKIRKLLQNILNHKPNNAQIITYLAESYFDTQEYEEAKNLISRALSINPIDYSAHRTLAEIFLKEDKLDSAVYSITKAHLYNRNSPALIVRLKEIYAKQEMKYYENWGFDPKYKMELDSSRGTVVITADGIWLTYGMYKAVWAYEPDYLFIKSQQEVSDYLFHAEMEAALGTFLTYSAMKREDKRHFPALFAFEMALDEELLEEYVMYEILLVDHPTLAAHLTDEFIAQLLDYIVQVRGRDATKN